jgi:hypothetical protein
MENFVCCRKDIRGSIAQWQANQFGTAVAFVRRPKDLPLSRFFSAQIIDPASR